MLPRTIKLTIIGALVGAVLGGTATWAISKVQEQKLPPELRTGQELALTASPQDLVGLAVSLNAVVRQVVQLFRPG
jgi:ABC-type lipoprotein release transport system permease subunit